MWRCRWQDGKAPYLQGAKKSACADYLILVDDVQAGELAVILEGGNVVGAGGVYL